MADKKPFRLLVVGMTWPPQTFLMGLVRGLAESGVEVTVAGAKRPSVEPLQLRWLPAPAWEGAAPLRLLRLGRMAALALTRATGYVRRMSRVEVSAPRHRSVWERLRWWNRFLPFSRGKWDAIYFPWNSAAIAYLPLFDLGIPVVVSCRGTQVNIAPHHRERTDICDGLRVTLTRAAAVHCVSEAMHHEAERYGADAAKIHIIRPAIDPSVFYPADRIASEGVFRIVMTGSLTWIKGYEYGLEAIRILRDSGVNAHLDIIGEGPERQRVLYNIHDMGLQGNARLLGTKSPEGVRSLLQQADAFLLSSVSEGISNAVLEAMGCGLPVVTTDCGGMREAVTDGVEGFVTRTRDSGQMADRLARLASDADMRKTMGAAARQRILSDFTLSDQVANWIALYSQLAPAHS